MLARKAPFVLLTKRGFTVVELLVCVAIMIIILGITLSGGPQAIMKVTLSDNTYNTELMLREAQLQGSAINSVGNLYGGVGVYFNLASSSQVLKFKDIIVPDVTRPIGIGNGLYEQTPTDEKEVVFKLSNNHKVGKLCVATGVAAFVCNDEVGPPIKTLTVSFNRPKQTAHIYINDATTTDFTSACIQLDSFRSPLPGYVRSILVYRSGMITKKLGTCK